MSRFKVACGLLQGSFARDGTLFMRDPALYAWEAWTCQNRVRHMKDRRQRKQTKDGTPG